MKKQSNRLNDTAALIPESMSTNESISVSVRKIDNGYVVSKTRYGGASGYKSSEKFSATKPSIDSLVNESEEESPDHGALSRAKAYLQKDPDDTLVSVNINGKGA